MSEEREPTLEELKVEVRCLQALVDGGIADMARMKAILRHNLEFVKIKAGLEPQFRSGFISGVDACLTHLEQMPWQKEFLAAQAALRSESIKS